MDNKLNNLEMGSIVCKAMVRNQWHITRWTKCEIQNCSETVRFLNQAFVGGVCGKVAAFKHIQKEVGWGELVSKGEVGTVN